MAFKHKEFGILLLVIGVILFIVSILIWRNIGKIDTWFWVTLILSIIIFIIGIVVWWRSEEEEKAREIENVYLVYPEGVIPPGYDIYTQEQGQNQGMSTKFMPMPPPPPEAYSPARDLSPPRVSTPARVMTPQRVSTPARVMTPQRAADYSLPFVAQLEYE